MRQSVSWFAVAVVAAASVGCKTTGKGGEPVPMAVDAPPPLLIGPEATAKAPPPVELPAKDAALLCLRTAQHYEKEGRTEDSIKLYEKARLSISSRADDGMT